jgi:endonuclease/exonuclease/phosphatase (EEP) superfamily protein YafD
MTFRVLHWNCMYSEDPAKIAAFITAIDPDIVCLQELTNGYHTNYPDTGHYLRDELNWESFYTYGPMVLPDGVETMMGVGIFSRFPLTHPRKLVLQEGVIKNRIISDERHFLEATIQLADRRVVLGTTHLPFHPRFQTTPVKQRMVETILAQVSEGAYILTGDLNTTPRTKAAVSFRKHGFRHAGPAFSRPTWTTKPFKIGPWAYDNLKWRLDYVFYKGALKPTKSEILETSLSDHLPILVTFEC